MEGGDYIGSRSSRTVGRLRASTISGRASGSLAYTEVQMYG